MKTEPTPFEKSIAAYKKVGISIEVLENQKGIPIVLAKQERLLNGYILNQKQLHKRAKNLFAPQKIHIKPSVFTLNVSCVTTEWIVEKQKEFGIGKKDLVKQLAIDKQKLNEILKGSIEPDRVLKVAFFYYFLVYEINNTLRETIVLSNG